MNDRAAFETLVAIMDRLRGPGGCPWDREQTYGTLRGYLLEECYEVVEALDRRDHGALREELGDLLFQIVFLSRLAREEGRFTARDVVRSIADKMVRRHPHVFGDAEAETPEEVLRHWESIKREEKGVSQTPDPADPSVLEGIPRALPALMKAHRLGTKAARVGFDWPDAAEVLEKIDEELREVRAALEAGDRQGAGRELGDVLFSVVMLARKLDTDPEAALEAANARFRDRFRRMEAECRRRGLRLDDEEPSSLERLWREAKAQTDRTQGSGPSGR